MTRRDGIIIAIDGPAGSGKSSTAKAVADELGYRHLDSGAFYRGLTLAALRAGIPPETWSSLTADDLDDLGIAARPEETGYSITLRGKDVSREIRSPEVNAHVSRMAAVPTVREWLLAALRNAGASGGLVADGRDIGTVVFPHAELKVFLVCSPEERARRRLREQKGTEPGEDEIRGETSRLAQRDTQDSTRSVAPLLRATDAIDIDTTGRSFDDQVSEILTAARSRIRA